MRSRARFFTSVDARESGRLAFLAACALLTSSSESSPASVVRVAVAVITVTLSFDGNGVDRVEFLISANPGEPAKPMAKVASGGETARLMLALKGALTHADQTPILIFDEIDQGIGGRVGGVVGQKLWNLTGQQQRAGAASDDPAAPDSRPLRHQVLCITHLPQLAAFADLHLTVRKQTFETDGELRTGTDVQPVEGPARVEELTQMLGAVSDAGRQSVVEMLDAVNRLHNSGP
jgi:DNA repair protein RecN (Recombination protein N)